MGVISFRCNPTDEIFFTTATDIPAKFNRIRFQLSAGNCPNNQLQVLWNQYGETAFEFQTVKQLKYDDPKEDHTEELEMLVVFLGCPQLCRNLHGFVFVQGRCAKGKPLDVRVIGIAAIQSVIIGGSNDNFFVHNLKTSWLLGFPADRFHRASLILLCDLLLGHHISVVLQFGIQKLTKRRLFSQTEYGKIESEVTNMHSERRKELLEAWKDRHPEMGVISFRCNPTDEIFFTTATDIPAKFNRIRFQLSAGNCPNNQLQALWNQYGERAFEFQTVKQLKSRPLLR